MRRRDPIDVATEMPRKHSPRPHPRLSCHTRKHSDTDLLPACGGPHDLQNRPFDLPPVGRSRRLILPAGRLTRLRTGRYGGECGELMGRRRTAGTPTRDLARYRRGNLDEPRRQPRWTGGGIRPAGRPVRDADRGRGGAGPDHRIRVGHAAPVQPGRAVHRVHERPGRRRQHLDHEPRRVRSDADHEGELPASEQSGVDPGLRVHRRSEALHVHTLGGSR